MVVDLGYATLPRLLAHTSPRDVDAVLISHGHPDHCADLNPLLRARALDSDMPAALPVFAPPRALDAVLALDRPGMLDASYLLHEFDPGARFEVGPFEVATRLLPHWVPNAGIRLTAGGRALVYTGDTGPCTDIADLARNADVLIAEATYAEDVPAHSVKYLSSALQAGQYAAHAEVGSLVLTHLWPGAEPSDFVAAARRAYDGDITVAAGGLMVELD